MTEHVTVLVVDDEEFIRDMVEAVLRSSGYVVLTASYGEQALTVFKQHSIRIKCLITDCCMPGMSGPQLAQRLVRLRPDLPVIFMSGSESGLVGYPLLTKPFTPAQLSASVRDVMAANSARQRDGADATGRQSNIAEHGTVQCVA